MAETETTESDVEKLTAEQIEALVADAPSPSNGGEENGVAEFVPADAAGVDWVLKKCAAARAEAKLIRENAELMARECERRAEHLEWKYGANLQTWLRAELAGGKSKRKRLLHGVLGYRTKPAGVCVTNPVAALAWATEHLPAAVALRLDKAALAEALLSPDFQATGESTDFAQLTPAEEIFFIK